MPGCFFGSPGWVFEPRRDGTNRVETAVNVATGVGNRAQLQRQAPSVRLVG
jgi:hypothetical protein